MAVAGGRLGSGSGAAAAAGGPGGRLSAQQRENVLEVFELFIVKLPGAARRQPTIELGEVTIGLRILGIEMSKEQFRRDVLPRYAERVSNGVDFDTFLAMVSDRWTEMERGKEVDRSFDILDADGSGVITTKSLKALHADLVRRGLETNSLTYLGEGNVAEWLNTDTWLDELAPSGSQQLRKEDWRKLVDNRSQLFNW
eukprot:TRINITY_DN46795_c0_g1_i1.p2 TRINITY_DN46795_c0_g1~~TRINITY_DN46795_c0_g1_i1.p2  ORF type:complete len:221 (+),score=84.18 TRINITY_DN46795_c0_g1_i1:70-663(+)